jgi:gluconolactonase
MREAMYGFITQHLKGEGDGAPIHEPDFKTENPEELRCYPGDSRPRDFVTIPKFAALQAKELLETKRTVALAGEEKAQQENVNRLRSLLRVPTGKDAATIPPLKREPNARGWNVSFSSEPGITLTAMVEPGGSGPLVILLNLDGAQVARKDELYTTLKRSQATVVTCDLRSTGTLALGVEKVGRAPDHNSAEWGLWLGRPLLGQWALDVQQLRRAIVADHGQDYSETIVIGEGPAGLVALAAASLEPGLFTQVATINSLTSFATDIPYGNQRLGTLVPGFLRDCGDVPQLAALLVSQRLVIAGGVSSSGKPVTADELSRRFESTRRAFRSVGRDKQLILTTPEHVLDELGLTTDQQSKNEPIFEPGAKLTKLSQDGAGGEGPAWDPQLGILTSGAKGIHQLTPDGTSLIFRDKAGTNGLLFDREGRLVCCEPVERRITRIDRAGKLTVLTDHFGGKRYNQPNDLTLDSKNRIYFSDPCYGSRADLQIRDENGNTVEGVYRIDPDGKVSRVIGREVDRANGVLVSPDDTYLFVADNNNDKVSGARKLYRFDLRSDGTIDPKSQKLIRDWGTGRGPDGVKQDARGRLYVAAGLNKPNPPAEPATDVKGGIYVLDPETGKTLAFLGVPTDEVTNCAFGGDDLKTLYITGGGTLYSIRTTTAGRVTWPIMKTK